MTFESEGLLSVAIYIWLPPASYDVFLTTLVLTTSYMYMWTYIKVTFKISREEKSRSVLDNVLVSRSKGCRFGLHCY